ncbi:aldo/keto reductase [Candidatus Saccharibacteria bacterium]|jgi:alcohol dehydrogenase (NADP+)|nr:aldo/keto reductase [Candidatus Saccharibacteria bacterium]
MQTISLNNDQAIPVVGYGTWRLSTDEAAKLTEDAIRAGYRHIDCAMIYGNEKEVGEGITNAISKNIVKREDIFVTSKLWNTDHAAADVITACKKTLHDLKLEYLDLYLVHWGVGFEQGEDTEPLDKNGVAKFSYVPTEQTWRAMESLVEEGLVKSIGVANFTAPMLVDLLSYAKIRPVMNQVELHPYHAQPALVSFCHGQDIEVTAYSPFGSAGAPLLQDGTINEVAAAQSCTAAQVALAWATQRSTVVISKSSNSERIKENIDSENVILTDREMQKISALDTQKIFVNPKDWWGFPYF